ncbi:ATP-dependent nuclease, partial [Azospirillum argentinense]
MKIAKVKITNFKCYEETFTLTLNDGLNVIVGANEAGKTTILEAIHLALTGLLHGRPLKNDLTIYLFNLAAQSKYVQSLGTASLLPPPTVTIELFFSGASNELAALEGDGNSERAKSSGVVYKIEFDEENYKDSYEELVKAGALSSIPVEYYATTMCSFARKRITARNIPVKSALIDSSSARLLNGSDVYVSRIIRDVLEEKERAAISQAHRKLRPYVRGLRGLAARPATCPNRGLRRTGRRRASDMEGGPDERYHLRGTGCPQGDGGGHRGGRLRGGEVRQLGSVRHTPEQIAKLAEKLAKG